jgi:hypothetical protein
MKFRFIIFPKFLNFTTFTKLSLHYDLCCSFVTRYEIGLYVVFSAFLTC